MGLAHVGQSAIIGPDKKIMALVKTDSINQAMIDQLKAGQVITSNASLKEATAKLEGDPFGMDSLNTHSFTLRSYQLGKGAMSKRYVDGPHAGRRISYWNATMGLLYRSAYGIKTYGKQEFYDSTVTKEEVNTHNMKNYSALYCVDLLAQPDRKTACTYYFSNISIACCL